MQILIFFVLVFTNCYADELSDSEKLKAELYTTTAAPHHPITYKQANDILFTKLDNHNGSVCSTYSPKNCLVTGSVPSPKLMNIEHTWPQSEGANGFAKSDLHHIFPVDSATNSIRSSLPFCDVLTIKWQNDQSKRGFSKFNEHCFEPPANHKGNVARALFYFSVRYQKAIDSNQEYFLRLWDKQDPIDQNEIERNLAIQSFQNNSNPFILNPELVDQITDF